MGINIKSLGQRFAMAEMKVVTSSLLRRFRFELPPNAPVPTAEVTLQSATGIHITFTQLK